MIVQFPSENASQRFQHSGLEKPLTNQRVKPSLEASRKMKFFCQCTNGVCRVGVPSEGFMNSADYGSMAMMSHQYQDSDVFRLDTCSARASRRFRSSLAHSSLHSNIGFLDDPFLENDCGQRSLSSMLPLGFLAMLSMASALIKQQFLVNNNSLSFMQKKKSF